MSNNLKQFSKSCNINNLNKLPCTGEETKEPLTPKFCYKHKNEDAFFYCDDCSEFICKTCFATEHRSHDSSTYDLSVKNIRENLQKTFSDLNSLKKNVDDNLQSVQDINNYFSTHKSNFKNTLKDINDRIAYNLNKKSKEFSEEIESIFNGLDFEVSNSSQRLENTKKKATRMINEIQSLYKEVDSIKSEKKICLFKKEKDSILTENMKFLTDLQFFLNQNFEKTKLKSVNEMETFSKKCDKFQKNVEIYENSVSNTILSGIPNICMRVRRFRKFYYSNTKFYKTNSICMMTSHTINLVGFSLCGLFLNKSTSSLTSAPHSIKIGIKIYEMEFIAEFSPNLPLISSVEVDVPLILNVIDPVFQFYLKNAVTIYKDKGYYIFMDNLSENNYVDMWSGEVSKEKDESTEDQHSVVCNNSNVKFNFINTIGVESDFNEFSGGVLSDIIFSHLD